MNELILRKFGVFKHTLFFKTMAIKLYLFSIILSIKMEAINRILLRLVVSCILVRFNELSRSAFEMYLNEADFMVSTLFEKSGVN